MFQADRLLRLHGELIELANETDARVVRDDVNLLLDTLSRFLPAEEAQEANAPVLTADQDAAHATQAPRGTWMAPDEPPAPHPPPPPPPPVPPAAPGKLVDVQITAVEPSRFSVEGRSAGQADVARTIRELLNGLVGRQLTPLGSIGFDFVLAIERRDVEFAAFLGRLYAGKPLLVAAADFSTPAGAALADWFNGLVQWHP